MVSGRNQGEKSFSLVQEAQFNKGYQTVMSLKRLIKNLAPHFILEWYLSYKLRSGWFKRKKPPKRIIWKSIGIVEIRQIDVN